MRFKFIVLLVIFSALCHGSARAQNTNFLAAADFSDLAFFESKGVTYKDGGQVEDGLQILKNHGINCVRLRLWTSSQSQAANDPYNFINNTSYTVPLAVRVKNAGLLLSLDFHYSDTWADPGHQSTPQAWTNLASLAFTNLVQLMRTYNSNTIVIFAAAGAMPDYVQIGNEITAGMLWPYGQVNAFANGGTQWNQLGQLINAAIQGIKDATNATGAKMPKIIIHIDRGGDWTTTMKFFDNLNAQGVSYDIIGESYYPFFHGDPTNLNICLSNAAIRYGKSVIIAETAFPWTGNFPTSWTNNGSHFGLYGYPPTPAGQVSFIAALAKIIKSVPNQLGAGVFYWGAEYQAANGVNEAGFNTASFFDADGNVLSAADAIGGMAASLLIKPSITSATDLQLQWPFSGAALQMVVSTNLASPIVWSPVTNLAQTTGAVFKIGRAHV
jgi:arabinogalactan endo-1,4-beta-galactosidase